MSKLFLVPTPVGNLKDITFRAVEVLQSVDIILCEDTRTSSNLLKHYKINKPLKAYHKHNEHKVANGFVKQILAGENIAVITDAGTPGISDPGYLLLKNCIENGVSIECLPGATAFVPALINSGFSSEKFVFEGFLPHKKGRQTRLQLLSTESRTIVFYESPHRLIKTLTQLKEFFGEERKAAVCRELTKMFEETIRGTFEELIHYYQENTLKGEIVLVVEGLSKKAKKDAQ